MTEKTRKKRFCILICNFPFCILIFNFLIPFALNLSIAYNGSNMISSKRISSKSSKTVPLRLNNGWSGRAALSAPSGGNFSKTDWADSLTKPELLFEDVEKILKTEGRNCVAVKNLTIGDSRLKVVIKRHHPQDSLRQFFRSFRPGKALRNFKTALQLISCGIPTATPFAALQQKRNLLTKQSIYITEYCENSSELFTFSSEQLSVARAGQFALKKEFSHQLATILASLHKNGLWNRDSKASNFIVSKDDKSKYRILLIDMDGIKPYFLWRRHQQFRSLWQLAASLMPVSGINRTDYLRTFIAYCNLVGLELSQRRRIFRELANRARAKRLRTIAKASSIENIMSESLKNILIIKPSSLGDIILALPALTALRKSFPDAKISWLIRPEFAPLLENHPHLTDVILFDRKLLGKAWYYPGAFVSLLSLIRRLRHSKFDAVIDFQGLFRTASLAWLSGCKKRLGMANARELARIFYTHKVAQDEDCIHLVDYYFKIIRTAGAFEGKVQFVLPQDPSAASSVGGLLTSHNIKPDNYAVFVPGSARSDKCWPIERFAVLADKISSQFNLSIVATGTESETSAVERLQAASDVPIANLTGQTSLAQLIALLSAARLVVSNDTGPGHIAAALGTPLVLIFGPTNPARVAPYGRSHCVAAVEPEGRGFKADSTYPKHDITAITVDEVYQKICEQMSR